MKIEAHLVTPDAAAASDWYILAFGATELMRIPLPDGKVMAVTMQIGESLVHVGSEFPGAGILSPASIGGTPAVLQINTQDARSLWNQALTCGAIPRHELHEAFWGELHGQIVDPFGHRWNIAERVRLVSHSEIVAGAAQIFGGALA